MRKKITEREKEPEAAGEEEWLDLETLASVEVGSEDSAHPVERALTPDVGKGGWLAGKPGPQTIRILFDEPQKLSRMRLVFESNEERFQEFVLRWKPGEGPAREIVRQQYNFSSSGATREVEDYRVNLNGVAELELEINPDKNGAGAFASLAEWRVR